jgi:transcriptional regulator with XRE-family HTH domain
MDRAGEKLRRARERLKLTYRHVAEASQEIAAKRGSTEFVVPLSRLADIENGGRVPTIFRLYTLCAIYRLDFQEVMRWYGVPADQLTAEALQISLEETHRIEFPSNGHGAAPLPSHIEIDFNQTTFLSQLVGRWAKLPLGLVPSTDHRQYRYGIVGSEDWSMFPILRPGSLVLIDQSRRKIARGGWNNEFDRPIYFLEHREGLICGWCTLEAGQLLVQPHPASEKRPSVFSYPDEIDVIGQVVGTAMLLEPKKRRHARPSATPAASPDRQDKAAAPPPEPMPE